MRVEVMDVKYYINHFGDDGLSVDFEASVHETYINRDDFSKAFEHLRSELDKVNITLDLTMTRELLGYNTMQKAFISLLGRKDKIYLRAHDQPVVSARNDFDFGFHFKFLSKASRTELEDRVKQAGFTPMISSPSEF
jgi:hypothetical protein